MAAVDTAFLAAQLKKLNKDELINLIINKNVSQISTLSEQVKVQLCAVLFPPNKDVREENATGDGSSTDVEAAEGENKYTSNDAVQAIKRENFYILKLNLQMEERLKEQSMLIKLLQQSKEKKTTTVNTSIASKSRFQETVLPSVQPSIAADTDSVISSQDGRVNIKNQNKPRAVTVVRGSANISTIPVGVKTNDRTATFAAVARRAYLYVGNVQLQTSGEMINTYLKKKFAGCDFVVEPLPVKDNAQSKAFKLTFDFSLLDELNKPEVWPSGVIVKRFFRAKIRK